MHQNTRVLILVLWCVPSGPQSQPPPGLCARAKVCRKLRGWQSAGLAELGLAGLGWQGAGLAGFGLAGCGAAGLEWTGQVLIARWFYCGVPQCPLT